MKSAPTSWFRPLHTVVLIAIGLLAAAAAACGGGGELAPKQEFTLRIAGDPSSLDPQLASFAEDISVAKQLFRGLFTYDEDLSVVPAVALDVPTKENGGISEDGLTYTINLRQDATWSDGKPVTADDFVYAFQRLFDPEAGAQGYYFDFYTAIEGAADFAAGEGSADQVGVSATDDYTLQIKLAHVQPTLPTLLALWSAAPLRQDVIEQYGDAWTEPGNLISNGPFVLVDYQPEDSITLEANAKYWGDDQPTLERLVYRIIPEDSAALIAYQNGEIDMTSIPAPSAADFEGDPEQIRYTQLETFAVQYNNQEPPFDDPLVRQAFSRAIDREAYVASVRQGVGSEAVSWLPPGMPGADASAGQDLDFDPEAAQALLDEAGYPNGDGFPEVTFTIVDDPVNRTTAEFLQAQLKDNLGVDIEIEALDENGYFDRYYVGDFQVTWLSWFADYADPENWLPQQFGTDGSLNVFGYSSTEVDGLFEQAAAEFDQDKRLSLYSQAHKIIIEEQALTPVFNPERNYLVKPNVTGLVTTVLDAEPGDWFVSNVQIMETEGDAPPASNPDE
ncbi:MAG: peptide ABC transporter substrate-binding protein [Dehalococcoidia bacterium]|nr:peptide ABC transporter substrate-binding protein [Dehalococcoidia bacterium]